MLDALHASLWREGKQFPKSQAEVTQMVADGELLVGLTFNPNEPANLVAAGTLPQTTIAWQHEKGTIGNTHFVAIPVNAKAKEGAQVFANFLLSPEAQARKNDIKVWGDPTVLAVSKLPADQQAAFAGASVPGSVTLPGPALLEPHASWVALLESGLAQALRQGLRPWAGAGTGHDDCAPAGALALRLLFLVPLAVALAFVVPGLFDAAALSAMMSHPQFGGALR